MDFKITAIISPEWRLINKPIQINDICAVTPSKQEFLCGYTIKYEKFEYLFFGSLDSDNLLFAIQTESNNHYYIKILEKKPEKIFALRLYKKARQDET